MVGTLSPHAQSDAPVVIVGGLTKVFRQRSQVVHAVTGVSFSVMPRELFGLFGANGAGKSTLVRMITTLLRPTAGTAEVCGVDVVRRPQVARSHVGLVTADERAFYGRLSPRRNLAFYAALQNVPRSLVRDRVQRVLGLFGLSEKADVPFQSLSTGQKQRLNMARALVHDPQVLILDEPTKSMDVQTSDFVKALIKDDLVASQRKSAIYISHELYEMDAFCDRVAILVQGELRALGTPEELAQQLPRRAIYRVNVAGAPSAISSQWLALEDVEAVVEISRGVTLTSFDVTLSDETSGVWLQMMRVVDRLGGRVETYQRVDNGSLRDIIRFFGDH